MISLIIISGTNFKALSLIVDKLRETLEELRRREPDAKPNFRVKIAVVGSEIDDPGFTKLVEDAGALVVVDR